MKRTILISSIVAAALISGAVVFMALKVDEKPKSKDGITDVASENYFETLKEAGFTHVPSVSSQANIELRINWAKKGFHFIGNDEMDNLLSENGLLIAPSDKFKDEIPDEAVKTFAENYNRAKALGVLADWVAPDNRRWTNEQVSKMNAEDAAYVQRGTKCSVYVCAHLEQLNTDGMIIVDNELKTANNDPIIVAKVDSGYIELAKWIVETKK